ncbi:MAG: methyl-accepting chemotaxis protein [Myxococcales bacterium]|nr:methyl-accepting chemotaxis protein [Myxococcales bacterium]
MKTRATILQKFILLFVAFGLVPLGVFVVATGAASDEFEKSVGIRLLSVSNTIADKIDRNLFERYGDVQAFATNHALRDREAWYRTSSPLVDAIDGYIDTYDIYYLSIVVDLEGRVVAVNSKDADGRPINSKSIYDKNYSSAPWFEALQAGQSTTRFKHTASGNDVLSGTFIETFHVDPDVGRAYPGDDAYTIAFSAPIYEEGAVIGYWSNRARFSLVEEIIAAEFALLEQQGFGNAELTLLNQDGAILVDYDPVTHGSTDVQHDSAVVGKLNLASKGVVAARKATEGESGWTVSHHARKQIDQLAGYSPLVGALGYPGMPWSVLVRVPRDQGLAPMTSMRNTALVALGVASAVLLFFGLVVARRTLSPLQEMARIAKAVAVGDIDQKVDTARPHDEVGELANALQDLIAYIRAVAEEADALARGDLDNQIEARSDRDVLSKSFARVAEAQKHLVKEVSGLTSAAHDGDLSARGDASLVQGSYSEVIRGVNELLSVVAAPIAEASRVLEQVAKSDLTARMQGEYRGEYDNIKRSMNTALDRLDQTIAQVASAAGQVATAASEITTGNQSIAESASEQAASVEGISRNLAGITDASKESSDRAGAVRAMVESAGESAREGTASMEKLSTAVERIKRSADETSKIVKTIDEIAFQTNLLALNAAVEAARAGDAGRGFAVVADEVRGLALRSAEAAKNTAKMIQESVKSADDGVALNQLVTESFASIADQVAQVATAIVDIESNATQQSDGVSQINGSLSEMSRATHHNAATTEETASAAEQLASQARTMRELAETFELGSSSGAITLHGPALAPAPPANDQARRSNGKSGKNGSNGRGSLAPALDGLDDADVLQRF